jgi:hypothetical protein
LKASDEWEGAVRSYRRRLKSLRSRNQLINYRLLGEPEVEPNALPSVLVSERPCWLCHEFDLNGVDRFVHKDFLSNGVF